MQSQCPEAELLRRMDQGAYLLSNAAAVFMIRNMEPGAPARVECSGKPMLISTASGRDRSGTPQRRRPRARAARSIAESPLAAQKKSRQKEIQNGVIPSPRRTSQARGRCRTTCTIAGWRISRNSSLTTLPAVGAGGWVVFLCYLRT